MTLLIFRDVPLTALTWILLSLPASSLVLRKNMPSLDPPSSLARVRLMSLSVAELNHL